MSRALSESFWLRAPGAGQDTGFSSEPRTVGDRDGDCKAGFWMQSTRDNGCDDCDDDDGPEMQMVNEGILLGSEMGKERRMK